MTNSYIKSVLEKGTFNVSSSFKLFGEIKTCEFKIDTGCRVTCIPIKRLGVDNDTAIDCKALKFYHLIKDWKLSQFYIGDVTIGVNYDRTSNILLGMDILKDWEIHIGKSILTGETTFLGCPSNQITKEYLQALEEEFSVCRI